MQLKEQFYQQYFLVVIWGTAAYSLYVCVYIVYLETLQGRWLDGSRAGSHVYFLFIVI